RYLKHDKRSSFAYTTLGDMFNPQYSNWENCDQDTSFHYIMKAIECDENDGNAWMSVWNHALRRGNDSLERLSLEKLYTTGFYTESVLEFNRWVLKSVPESSIVITNGDFDTYPALSLQITEALRNDVTILNFPMLTLEWYAKMAHERIGIPLTLEYETVNGNILFLKEGKLLALGCDSLVSHWLKTIQKHSSRPLVFACTFDQEASSRLQYPQTFRGAYWYYRYSDIYFEDKNRLDQLIFENVSPEKLKGAYTCSTDRSPLRNSLKDDQGLKIVLGGALTVVIDLIDEQDYTRAGIILEKVNQTAESHRVDSKFMETIHDINTFFKQKIKEAAKDNDN
ncbi:MAG: hypothetical protein ACOCW1_04350, partial [Chitinispirillaceae bacterium]